MVTRGPMGKAYFDAFPLPTECFVLLYSRKYSLIEAYDLSKRYLSWKMVVCGGHYIGSYAIVGIKSLRYNEHWYHSQWSFVWDSPKRFLN